MEDELDRPYDGERTDGEMVEVENDGPDGLDDRTEPGDSDGHEQLTFEEAYAQLERIVGRLEGDDMPLEESLKLYEEGVRLAELCGKTLEAVTLRVQQVDAAGQPTGDVKL